MLAEADLRRNPHLRPARPAADRSSPTPGCIPSSRTRGPVQRSRSGQPRHLGQQPHALSRRPLRPALRHQPVRQRAGAQPRPSDGARAGRSDLSRRPGPGRDRSRVPRLDRQLVPADAAQDRARRRPLGRRHVPRGDRASRVDPGRRPEEDRPSRRQPGRADLPRLSPSTARPRPIPRLDRLDTAGLVAALDSPSGWQRDTAQRLLMHRSDPRGDRAAARAGPDAPTRPQTRVQAIWTLSLLGGLDEATAPGGPGRPASPGSTQRRSRRARICSTESPRLAEAAARPGRRSRPARPASARPRRWATGTIPGPGQALARIAPARPGRPLDPRGGAQLGRAARRDAARRALFAAATSRPAAVVEPLVALAGSVQDRAAIDSVVRAIGDAGGAGGSVRLLAIRGAAGTARGREPVEAPDRARPRAGAAQACRRSHASWSATTRPPRPTGSRRSRLLGFSAATQARGPRPAGRPAQAREFRSASSRRRSTALGSLGRPQGARPLAPRGWKTHSPQVRSGDPRLAAEPEGVDRVAARRRSRTAACQPPRSTRPIAARSWRSETRTSASPGRGRLRASVRGRVRR